MKDLFTIIWEWIYTRASARILLVFISGCLTGSIVQESCWRQIRDTRKAWDLPRERVHMVMKGLIALGLGGSGVASSRANRRAERRKLVRSRRRVEA